MKKEIIIALLFIMTLLLSIWGFQYLKGSNILKKNLTFYSVYTNVKDIDVASEVFVNGYKVGTVTSIDLNPDNVNEIRVEYEVSEKIRVPKTAKATIKNTSIMGGRFIELEFTKMCSGSGDCAADGDMLTSSELGLLGSMVNKSEISEYTNLISNSVSGSMSSDSLGNVDPAAALKNLETTIQNLADISEKMGSLLANSNKSLEQSFSNLSSITQNVANNNDRVQQIIKNVELTSVKLATLELDPTIQKANETVDITKDAVLQLKGSVKEINATIAKLSGVIDNMNSQDGSLGNLIHDRQLYDNLEETSNNLSLLLQDLRLNPKRYVNVSVFGKKQKEYTTPENDPAYQK